MSEERTTLSDDEILTTVSETRFPQQEGDADTDDTDTTDADMDDADSDGDGTDS